MKIPWPIGTAFRVITDDGEKIWIVSEISDTPNGVISDKSPIGNSLLMSGENRRCLVDTQDGQIELEILSIKTPDADEDIFDSPFEYFYSKYYLDRSGIRLKHFMADICLECGQENPASLPGTRKCENCGTAWIVNHCWNCGSPVDSRDPNTPKCEHRCGGCTCAKCKHCFCDAPFIFQKRYVSDDE